MWAFVVDHQFINKQISAFQFLLAELNTFYLKFVLWVEPGHWVNLVRLIFILPWGAVALREVFQFLDDP